MPSLHPLGFPARNLWGAVLQGDRGSAAPPLPPTSSGLILYSARYLGRQVAVESIGCTQLVKVLEDPHPCSLSPWPTCISCTVIIVLQCYYGLRMKITGLALWGAPTEHENDKHITPFTKEVLPVLICSELAPEE